MSDPLARLLPALHRIVPRLDGTGLAEALWLAARMAESTPAPPPPPAPGPGVPQRDETAGAEERAAPAPAPAGPPGPPDGAGTRPRPAVTGAGDPPASVRPLHERLAGASHRMRGHAVAAPRAAVLPGGLELTRALRPWKRPWPRGRGTELDMDATVDGYARSGELIPVFAAAPERWFDLALVVDRSPGMRVWQETVTELTATLDRLGAFRTLQVSELSFDAAGRPRDPSRLRSADGRRLVLVISDCAADGWRRPEVWHQLRDWAGATPTAVLNPLPTRLWRRGGLNLPTVTYTPAAPGAHRSRLPLEPPALALAGADATAGTGADRDTAGRGAMTAPDGSRAWLPVPVLSLTPHSLGRWSRALMRGDPEGCTAVLVPPTGRLPRHDRPPAVPLPPATLAKGFLRTASSRAARLAVLCSPFDRLSLRLLHVVRRALVPDATVAEVAEVVTSGVFLPEPADGDQIELVLPPEAQAVLREELPAHELWEVRRALDRHVASGGDGPARFPAVAHDPAGPRELAAERAAFAHASRRTLELLGLAPPDAAPGAGTPPTTAGPDTLPPAPLPFADPDDTVARTAAGVESGAVSRLWITAGNGGSGAGRTAFALHLAHRLRDRFPDGRLYLDLRGSWPHPVPAEAALWTLLRDLGTPPGEIPTRTEELAEAVGTALRGRRTLLVLDDVPPEGEAPDTLTAVIPEDSTVIHTSRWRPPAGAGTTATGADDGPLTLGPLPGEAALALLPSRADRSVRESVAGRQWWPLALRVLSDWIASGDPPAPNGSSREYGMPRGDARTMHAETFLPARLDRLEPSALAGLALLALIPTGRFSRVEAMTLLDQDPGPAARLLRDLTRRGLVEHESGLLRAVREWAHPMRGGDAPAAAGRLLASYLRGAATRYARRHPGTSLPERLGVLPAREEWPDDGWVENALALAASDDGDDRARWGRDGRAALLLLLQDEAASPRHRGLYVQAARRLTAVAEPYPESRALFALAQALYEQGELDESREALLSADTDREQDPSVLPLTLLMEGRLAFGGGDLARAASRFEEAAELFRQVDDRHGEATARLEYARVQLRRERPEEAANAATEALQIFKEHGADEDAQAARRVRDVAWLGVERRERTVPCHLVAVAATPENGEAVLGAATRALSGGAGVPGDQLDARSAHDCCLLFVPQQVSLDLLFDVLAGALPAELEAQGLPPGARVAVHTGSVRLDATERLTEPGVEYTRAMLRSAEFRRVSGNYPEHPTLCVSPEAFDGLPAERTGRSFIEHRVTSRSGEVVCLVLTPRLDLSAYDAELLALARVFNERDPGGRRLAGILRDGFDAALDPADAGRFARRGPGAGETRRAGAEVVRGLLREFPFGDGSPATVLRWERTGRQGPVPLHFQFSASGPDWRLPSEWHGALCLLVHADDLRSRWSAGLVRVRSGTARPQDTGTDGSGPDLQQPHDRHTVLWLHREAPLPENVLLHLDQETREAVLTPADPVERIAELFRRVRAKVVPTGALRALAPRQNVYRSVRTAAAALQVEGILVLTGNRRGREAAAGLRLPLPEEDEYVSVRLTRRRPDHLGRPSVLANGVAWTPARPDDPVEPLPGTDLPRLRRAR
ncbi:hypothetical protein NX801_28390 [Streptomyces sp. LP05-1]|uniref:Type II restriction enzyme NaeI domain-containing protein n=1 Tax=Streptomyces pyxinae TaxID=2970734 RepID=A0ABT2CSC8_9ACTN|nr:NaeI family type II restriction endonuclease [Streptomyces sp. LP05-1]MCS0639484.1 hypothetical protein [Streptomyces sp. LP05-1]